MNARKLIMMVLAMLFVIAAAAKAEEPVYFADANLKAAVEETLAITNPTPTDMLALTNLSANNRGIVDLTGLEYAANLTDLQLNANQINDISAVSGLTNLTRLELTDNEISNISPLSGLTNLTALALDNNQISDISTVSGLTNLVYLYLSNNQISDVFAVSGLTNLTTLGLNGNQISDISALSELTNLTKLVLNSNQISDISPVWGLTNLTDLRLNYNQISDIYAVSGLMNLVRLELQGNQISDISTVSGLTNLMRLKLKENQINDISSVSGLTNLTWLGLAGNQISDISPLSGLTNLTDLRLGGNQISDISAVSGMTNLISLFLWGNQISDISALARLTNLKVLYLDSNQISDISPLSGLTNLRRLILWSNQISDISPLAGLADLVWLELDRNQISDISALAGLTNLTRLRLYNNQISDISALYSLTNLEWLYLQSNYITNIYSLTGMQNLIRLELQDNFLVDKAAYCADLPLIKMNNPTAEIIHDLNPYNCQTAEIISGLDYEQALTGLDQMRASVADMNDQSYYSIHRGERVTLNHPETLLTEIDLLREQIDTAPDSLQTSYRDELCRKMAAAGLVCWNFSTLTQISKNTLPPSLEDDIQVNISACVGETEPAGFYLTNLSSQPLAVAVQKEGDVNNLSIRWVTTHEGLPEGYKGPTPELIARIVPLVLGKYLLIPPYESRQVFIEADTRGLEPGMYAGRINISASSSGVLNTEFISRWIPGMSAESLTNIEPLHFPALSKTVFVTLQVHPIVLPAKARFGVYTWNSSGTESPEYIRLLVAHKVNLFAVGEPSFRIADGRVELDPMWTGFIKRNIEAAKPHGQFISLYGFVQKFTGIAKEEYGVEFMEGDYAMYLEDYFRKYIALLKESGLDYDDYTLQLWDEPEDMETFRKIKQACDLLHGVDPEVRFMVDPLCKLQDGYELIAEHIYMWIPHGGMVYVSHCDNEKPLLDMVEGGFDPNEWGRNNNKSIQWFLHTQREERGAYCMTYSQYGGNSNLCPVGYFRHFPWKMWGMRFDGITFWNAWPLTNGNGSELGINKGLVGWREGVEDVQHLYMLKDAIDLMKRIGVPQEQIDTTQTVLDQCTDMGVKCKWDCWWCKSPLEAEAAMNQSRLLIIQELLRLRESELLPFAAD